MPANRRVRDSRATAKHPSATSSEGSGRGALASGTPGRAVPRQALAPLKHGGRAEVALAPSMWAVKVGCEARTSQAFRPETQRFGCVRPGTRAPARASGNETPRRSTGGWSTTRSWTSRDSLRHACPSTPRLLSGVPNAENSLQEHSGLGGSSISSTGIPPVGTRELDHHAASFSACRTSASNSAAVSATSTREACSAT